ncbi:MAG: LacI family DNA-binding transcriptional regulator [Lachnospiraceae bacterium]
MSIKEIAKKAGVSTATVSRVLNNSEYKCSSQELRERIWKIAREMNYMPNEAARNLKKGIVSMEQKIWYVDILLTRTDSMHNDPFFSELLHIMESEIHKHSCILLKVFHQPIFSNDKKCRLENIDKILEEMEEKQNQKSDGLIIIGKCNEIVLKKLAGRYRGIVSVNRNSTNYLVDEILCDGKKIASMAVEYLIQLGHRRIGYAGGCHNESRYKGYQDTLFQHNIDLDINYIIETEHTEVDGYRVMEWLIQQTDPPTAIYCANDMIAIGMLKCLSRYKNRYYSPSIISSDDIDEAQYIKPMLTTVQLPKEEMGKFAINLLLDRLNGGHKAIVRMELEGKLMVRESCTTAENVSGDIYYI